MSLYEYLHMLRRRWRWVTAALLLAVAVAGSMSLSTPASYQATSSVFFSIRSGNTPNELAEGAAYTQGQVASYAMLATTPAVLQPVIKDLHLATTARILGHQVSTSVVPSTVMVEVSVTDSTPAGAARLTNAVTQQLAKAVQGLSPVNDAGQPTIAATTVAPALPPSQPAGPRTSLNLAIGVLAGLIIGILAALMRDLTDTRVRTAEDLEQVSGLPLLASMDNPAARGTERELIVATDPRGPQAEAFRVLRTAVQFTARPGQTLSLLVTSPRPGDGKSTVAANLAVTLAESGLRVALVDADLRRPSVADTFGLEGAAGLTSVLIGQAGLDEVLQDWGASGLHVLTTGPLPPNPSELLASPAMSGVLARLAESHDVVVFDAPPLLPVTDASILARITSATLLVTDASRTRRPVLRQAISLLERVEARVAGVVFTHVRQRGADVYGYMPAEKATQAYPRPARRSEQVAAMSGPPAGRR